MNLVRGCERSLCSLSTMKNVFYGLSEEADRVLKQNPDHSCAGGRVDTTGAV